MPKNKSPDKKKSPDVAAPGGMGLSAKKFNHTDSVTPSVTSCQLLTVYPIGDPRALSPPTKAKSARTRTLLEGRRRQNDLLSTSDYTLHIEKRQYVDPIDALLLQATARMQAAPDDETWQKHFRIWRSVHRLKAAEEVTP